MNCSYRGGHILSVLVMMINFFRCFLAKFLNKVWEKDYFTDMKASKFLAMLSSWNYKDSNCYELLLQRGPHPVGSRDDGEIFVFIFFSLNSWIKFEKRIILPRWKNLNSFQCLPVEITELAIAMNCSYREGHILSVLVMMVKFFFYFFLVKFLNKFWEKDYFTEMKPSKLFPMLSSWNHRVSNCYELLLQRGPHPVCSRDDGEIFFLFFSR